MSKTNWQDPQDGEVISTDISGLQDAVGKIEDAIGLGTTVETDISLVNVPAYNTSGAREYRIYQASVGQRNWLANPAPTVKKNGSVITNGFSVDYGGGAILLDATALVADVFTASFTRTNSTPTIAASNITEDTTHRFVTDTEKNIWDGKQAALEFTPENGANKGEANGYAELDSGGKVPSSQLPSMNYIPTSEKGAAGGVAEYNTLANHLADTTEHRNITFGTASPTGGTNGDIYLQYE